MLRFLASAFLCAFTLLGCGRGEDSTVSPARPELVEVVLDETGHGLSFLLPDAEWRRVEDAAFKGFIFDRSGMSLRVEISLKEATFHAVEAAARKGADGSEIRAFEPGTGWPFVGVVVRYRGPPDAPLLDAFVHSFKVERR